MSETDHAGYPDRPAPQGRGQLRIYLGSAAGVGKTYAMLCEAHRRAERGTDVVVAFVETHGRPHTAALIEGLEVIRRQRLAYRGTAFEEMDLDEVLDVDVRDDVDPGLEQFLHVLPALLVARSRDVGVGELVDQRDLGMPGQHRVEVHFLEGHAPV